METKAIIEKLNTIPPGTWFTVEYITTPTLSAAAKKQGVSVRKFTRATLRKGIRYEEQKRVRAKIERGEITPSHKLPYGEWHPEHKGLIIQKEDKEYVRFYPTPNRPKSTYFLNGEPISRGDLEKTGYVIKSYFTRKSSERDALDLKPESIISIIIRSKAARKK